VTGGIGEIALLLLDAGRGRIAQHPHDWLTTRADADFEASFRDAWRTALEHALGPEDARPDTVWRVLALEGKQPLADAGGRSASGAACYGWMRGLANQVVDRVLVMLDVHGARFEPVESVKAKLEALLEHNRRRNAADAIRTVVLCEAQRSNLDTSATPAEIAQLRDNLERAGIEVVHV
jgi:hypothetical protein